MPFSECFASLQASTSYTSEAIPWGISVLFKETDVQIIMISTIRKDRDVGFLYFSNVRGELSLKT